MLRFLGYSVLCLFLAACHAASPYFAGVPPKRMTIEGVVFDIRVRNGLAEANRISLRFAPRFQNVAVQAARAMRIVSGCEVVEVRGDPAQIVGILACDSVHPNPLPAGTEVYDCVVIDRATGDPDVVLMEDYDCNIDPI